MIKHVKSFNQIAIQIEKTNCGKLNHSQLFFLIKEYFKKAQFAHNFLFPMLIADRLLSQNIIQGLPRASDQKKNFWLATLTYPNKENIHTEEARSFYHLAKVFKKSKLDFESSLAAHIKNYSWIGTRGYHLDRAWTKNDIIDRLKLFISQKKHPEHELKYIDTLRQERSRAAANLIHQLEIKPSSKLYKIIHLAKEFAFLRTWRTDIMYRAGYRARNLFYEIAKRANFPTQDIIFLTLFELIKMAQTGRPPITQSEIKKRRKGYITLIINGQFKILSGLSLFKQIDSLIRSNNQKYSTLRGWTAYPGKVRGCVKIVIKSSDLNKVRSGDILVAVMTFPNLISAMEKAAAFVTDEGGILCHAAIVSREMKRPCIIGTKIATKLLNDGDKVEVDATKGIVKKI